MIESQSCPVTVKTLPWLVSASEAAYGSVVVIAAPTVRSRGSRR